VYQFFFPFSLFLSASLLFIIQPLVAKVLLPVYGGTPAVWTICMLFFQAVMLIAYSYAWILSRLNGARWWRVVHLCVCLLSVCALPLAFVPGAAHGIPELQILTNLLLQLGLPLLVVGSSAPLLQFAYSQTKGKRAADPYFLYVASNVGSLLALLCYPWIVERYFGVNQQFYGWNAIYFVYLGFLLFLMFFVHYEPIAQSAEKSIKIAWSRLSYWVFLSFIPCSLMLGVTFYISTDVAATPLFWVLPLALYLLSFVVTFARNPIISHDFVVRNTLVVLVFPILGFILGANQITALQLIGANLAGFFMLALLCHGELVRNRPEARQLTTFYFCLSLGGVFAGLFNGLLAPRIFSHAYEYPLVLLLALLCMPRAHQPSSNLQHQITGQEPLICPAGTFSPNKGRREKGGRYLEGLIRREWFFPSLTLGLLLLSYFIPSSDSGLWHWVKDSHSVEIVALSVIVVFCANTRTLFLSMAILFMFIFLPWFKSTQVLTQQRNFYGVKQVFSMTGTHVLLSQSTVHGFQVLLDKNPNDGARAYYGAVFPVVQRLQAIHESLHAMVLGLGSGIMACQFRPQDKLTMIEIDEQVIAIASNPQLFTYLRDCPSQVSLIKNDGLLAVTNAADKSYDLLVMDAFSSDAIPVHLLTVEAFALYKQKIIPDGVILVNISNRYMRLLPVLTGAGRELDMIVLHKVQAANNALGQFASEWAILTSNERLASSLMTEAGWRFVADVNTQVWTNDYSNIIPLLKW
jgi:hypothetical protein